MWWNGIGESGISSLIVHQMNCDPFKNQHSTSVKHNWVAWKKNQLAAHLFRYILIYDNNSCNRFNGNLEFRFSTILLFIYQITSECFNTYILRVIPCIVGAMKCTLGPTEKVLKNHRIRI